MKDKGFPSPLLFFKTEKLYEVQYYHDNFNFLLSFYNCEMNTLGLVIWLAGS